MSQSSNHFFEKEGRKRTMYRRPSQLGVPDVLFPKDSEYLSNYRNNGDQKRPDKTRPKTSMRAEGLDFAQDESTTPSIVSGSIEPVAKPTTKLRPKTKLKMEGKREWLPLKKNEYFRSNEKPLKSKGHDNLKPLEGSMEGQSEVRTQFQGKFMPRETSKRPNSNIKATGQRMELYKRKDELETWTTETQKVWKTRPKTTMDKSGELELIKGNREDYPGYTGKPVQSLKRSDYLMSEGDFESGTTSKQSYSGQQIGLRQVAPKQKANLQFEGLDFAQGTGKNDYVKVKDHKAIKVEKRPDFLKTDGEFESETIFKKYYKNNGKQPKLSKTRPKTTMDKSGELDLLTGNRESFSKQIGIRKISPPQKSSLQFQGLDFADGTQKSDFVNHRDYKPKRSSKIPDNLSSIQENIDAESEAKKSFKAYANPGKPSNLRPKTSLENSGDFDLKTTLKENNEHLKNIQVTKVKFQKVPDNLKSNGGRMEAESVSKNSYQAWQGPKPAKAGPPTGNLRRAQSADFNFSRTSQDYNSGISTVKPAKVRVGTALKPDGRAEGKSEYHEKYQKATSMLDLRAKPSWFTDLTTPYGTFAGGQARALGHIPVY